VLASAILGQTFRCGHYLYRFRTHRTYRKTVGPTALAAGPAGVFGQDLIGGWNGVAYVKR
jgi:hypothetical protein